MAGAFGKAKNSPEASIKSLLRDLQKMDEDKNKKPTPQVVHFFTKTLPQIRLAQQLNQAHE